MSYAPGAPEQVWAIAGLDDGAKLTLLWLWSRADHDVQRDPRPCTVHVAAFIDGAGKRHRPGPSLVLTIQARVHPDKTERTIRGHLTRLRAAGLADADGRHIDLNPPTLATACQVRPQVSGDSLPEPGNNSPQPGNSLPTCGHNLPPQLTPPVPPTPPSPAVEARATPTPSPIATSSPTRGLDALTPGEKLAVYADEQAGVLDPPSFADRVKAASEAAAYALATSATTSPHSWESVMTEAGLDLGLDDDDKIRALELWEAAPKRGKPTMGRLWQRSTKGGQGGRDWVRDQLGLGVQAPTTKRTTNGQAAFEHMQKRQRQRDAEERTRLAVVS